MHQLPRAFEKLPDRRRSRPTTAGVLRATAPRDTFEPRSNVTCAASPRNRASGASSRMPRWNSSVAAALEFDAILRLQAQFLETAGQPAHRHRPVVSVVAHLGRGVRCRESGVTTMRGVRRPASPGHRGRLQLEREAAAGCRRLHRPVPAQTRPKRSRAAAPSATAQHHRSGPAPTSAARLEVRCLAGLVATCRLVCADCADVDAGCPESMRQAGRSRAVEGHAAAVDRACLASTPGRSASARRCPPPTASAPEAITRSATVGCRVVDRLCDNVRLMLATRARRTLPFDAHSPPTAAQRHRRLACIGV